MFHIISDSHVAIVGLSCACFVTNVTRPFHECQCAVAFSSHAADDDTCIAFVSMRRTLDAGTLQCSDRARFSSLSFGVLLCRPRL